MIAQMLSIVGTFYVLIAYYMITHKGFRPNGVVIMSFNVFGSLMLLTTALILHNIGYIILNVTWILIAIIGFMKEYNAARDSQTTS